MISRKNRTPQPDNPKGKQGKDKEVKCGLKHIHDYWHCCAACIHGENLDEGANGHMKNCKYYKKPTKETEQIKKLWKSWHKRYPDESEFNYFVSFRILDLLSQQRQVAYEEGREEMVKKIKIVRQRIWEHLQSHEIDDGNLISCCVDQDDIFGEIDQLLNKLKNLDG